MTYHLADYDLLTLIVLTCFPVRMIPSLLIDVDLPYSADNYCTSYYETSSLKYLSFERYMGPVLLSQRGY
jgi:hypothetical protein